MSRLQEWYKWPQSNYAHESAYLWQMMSREQRKDAVGSGRIKWCKAMEILYLRMAGEEELAARVATSTSVSARKISRVLRQLGRKLAAEMVTE